MRISYGGNAVAEISTLPGSSQIAVVHSSFVREEARGSGVGYRAHIERLSLMKVELLYDMAVCTVDDTNIGQIKILLKAGWTKGMTFKSRKTGHDVSLWSIDLTKGEW